MALAWSDLRPFNGSQHDAFEELCVQLARAECRGTELVRKGTPDAGVECYTVLADGSEWGWQAKYFLTAMGAKQWQQIGCSVSAALQAHPKLVRYYVCVPRDRADGRRSGQKSEMDRWNTHVSEWQREAAARGMSVEFVFWGSSELLEQLQQPRHAGRRLYWFGTAAFDAPWFEASIATARAVAGPRYTPELHVELPLAQDFEAFGHTPAFRRICREHSRSLRRSIAPLRAVLDDNGSEPWSEALIEALTSAHGAADVLRQIGQAADDGTRLDDLLKRAEELSMACKLVSEAMPSNTEDSSPAVGHDRSQSVNLRDLLHELRSTRDALRPWLHLASGDLLLLTGEAGTGKTHLLCDVARARAAAGLPTILLMGQRFTSTDEPWSQALAQLDLRQHSVEEVVGALEAAAQAARCRALVVIDALNEGLGREIWRSHLAAFLRPLRESPWIGVVLSVRTGFERVVLPETEHDAAIRLEHDGFGSQTYDAVRSFFAFYGLELASAPPLHQEFSNPLLLKMLCSGFKARGVRRVPRGSQGASRVFEAHLEAVGQTIARQLGLDAKNQPVRRALDAVAERLANGSPERLHRDDAKQVVDTVWPGANYATSLYAALVAEGLLLELPAADGEHVVFGYERLGDHLVAQHIVAQAIAARDNADGAGDPSAGHLSEAALQAYRPSFEFLASDANPVSPSLLEALCTVVPERLGVELTELLPAVVKRYGYGHALRQSLIWRESTAIGDPERALALLDEADQQDCQYDASWEMVLSVAALPDHPLNANFLHQDLMAQRRPDRDARWSIVLHHLWAPTEVWPIKRLIEWADAVQPDADVDSEVIELCATALVWMFTTANRFLRDKATMAVANVLTGRLDAAGSLIERFAGVDDLYVSERLYAAVYGAVLRTRDPKAVGAVANVVHRHVFAERPPVPHVLLRDYARGVIERAAHLGVWCGPDLATVRPPYGSPPPRWPTSEEVGDLIGQAPSVSWDSQDPAWSRHRIVCSVAEDDFAHYVLGDNFSQRSAFFTEPGDTPLPLERIKQYIIKRVFELGWKTELFGAFDRHDIGYHGREAAKAERIGKKYQWLAYHEVLALLADHYPYQQEYQDVDREYGGPWQLNVRDIDPSSPPRRQHAAPTLAKTAPAWWCPQPPSAPNGTVADEEWVYSTADLPDLPRLLKVRRPADGTSWLSTHLFQRTKIDDEPDSADLGPSEREVWCWCHAYLLAAGDVQDFMAWAETVTFWGRWLPEPDTVPDVFLGEVGWAPAWHHLQRNDGARPGWIRPERDCPVDVLPTALLHGRHISDFDCSASEPQESYIPTPCVCELLGWQWTGSPGRFVDGANQPCAYDPSFDEVGPSALLLAEAPLRSALAREGLSLCWIMLGEKAAQRQAGPTQTMRSRLTGAVKLGGHGLTGFVNLDVAGDDDASQRELKRLKDYP